MSTEEIPEETKKSINELFDVVTKIEKECGDKIKLIQPIIQALKHLRQGSAQNILGDKLSDTEVNDLLVKIKSRLDAIS